MSNRGPFVAEDTAVGMAVGEVITGSSGVAEDVGVGSPAVASAGVGLAGELVGDGDDRAVAADALVDARVGGAADEPADELVGAAGA